MEEANSTALTVIERPVEVTPELLTSRRGYVKVRLRYHTSEPRHVRSVVLQANGVSGPYFEDVHILVPQRKAFPLMEAYLPQFEQLKVNNWVSRTGVLRSVQIVDEDQQTLAYNLTQ